MNNNIKGKYSAQATLEPVSTCLIEGEKKKKGLYSRTLYKKLEAVT